MTDLESLALLIAELYGQVRALQTENQALREACGVSRVTPETENRP